MLKFYLRYVIFILAQVLMFGFVFPALVSSHIWPLFVLGLVLAILYIPVTLWYGRILFKATVVKLKELFGEV